MVEFNLSEKIRNTTNCDICGTNIHTSFVKEFIKLLKEKLHAKHYDKKVIYYHIDKLAGDKLNGKTRT